MSTLSEASSKDLLRGFGVPLLDEFEVDSVDEAVQAAGTIGGPVVLKLCGERIAHKTERGLVRLGLHNAEAVRVAGVELLKSATPADGAVTLLVAPMVRATRELIAGASTDPQFGPTVLLGVGGVLAEAVADVVVRLAPIGTIDALEMIDDLATQRLLGPFRGEPAADRHLLAEVLCALSTAITSDDDIEAIDLNPILIVDGRPVAVDALVERRGGSD